MYSQVQVGSFVCSSLLLQIWTVHTSSYENKSGEKIKHLAQVQIVYPQVKNSCVEVWIVFSSSVWGRLNTHLYNPKCFTTKLKLQNKCSSLILYLSDEYSNIHYFSRNESQVDHCCMLLNSYFVICSYWFSQTSIFIMQIHIFGSIKDTDVFLTPKCSSFHALCNIMVHIMFLFRGKDFFNWARLQPTKYTQRDE